MKMIYKAFAKKLFGAKCERLVRTIFIYLVVFWGLYIADFKVQIAPSILYLTVTTFTAGVMWQALSSEDNAVHMQNMVMLPFEGREFVFAYVAAMGAYTLLTKTAALLAVLLAVSAWSLIEISGGILCAVNAVLMTAAVFSLKKYWYAGALWIAAVLAAVVFLWDRPWFLAVIIASSAFAFLRLRNADGYSFYLGESRRSVKYPAASDRVFHPCGSRKMEMQEFPRGSLPAGIEGRGRCLVWIYLFRYLKSHKNYLVNTVIMWCVACVLPLFFGQMESLFAVPLGFAILSLNTPICILLSCDRALEQAVRFLPGQKKAFCIPYCLFIFLCNIAADAIFLCSLYCNLHSDLYCSLPIQTGCAALWMIAAAVFFALQSAIFSILLEWFCPVRGWKIESDLWHHPRKYIVPTAMILLAGAVGAMPGLLFVMIGLLVIEIAVLLIQCGRC